MRYDKMPQTIKFGCMSKVGILLTIAIIAVRAFQPGAAPIAEWSIGSWLLMLIPTFFPLLVWLVLMGAMAILYGVLAICNWLCNRKRRY